MTKQVSKYTATMTQMIVDAQPINFEMAGRLANTFNEMTESTAFSAKSVVAKVMRMDGVEYQRKVPVSKTGAPIARKDAVVEKIEALVGANLNGLEKAPKLTLQRLHAALAA